MIFETFLNTPNHNNFLILDCDGNSGARPSAACRVGCDDVHDQWCRNEYDSRVSKTQTHTLVEFFARFSENRPRVLLL
jgi:hypothetical protein